jgi:hypothetical protein
VEAPRRINILQFVRKKQSKRFLLKFAAYFFMIAFILTILFHQLSKNGKRNVKDNKSPQEIRGLKIQVEDSNN